MERYIEENDDSLDDVFGFMIYEYELDCFLIDDIRKSKRSYFPDGSQLCENIVDEAAEEPDYHEVIEYVERNICFQPGDIVEVFRNEFVQLEIVVETPLNDTILNFEGVKDNYLLDRYVTLHLIDENCDPLNDEPVFNEEYHYSDPDMVHLYPPRFPIQDALKDKLKSIYHDFNEKHNIKED